MDTLLDLVEEESDVVRDSLLYMYCVRTNFTDLFYRIVYCSPNIMLFACCTHTHTHTHTHTRTPTKCVKSFV